MSIAIKIMTDGNHIVDSYEKDNATRNEVAVALLRLKQIELDLLSIEFPDDSFIETSKKSE